MAKIPNRKDAIRTITHMRLTQSASKYTIVQWLIDKYNISKVAGYQLIKEMEESIVDIYISDITKQVELAISKYESIQESAFKRGNLKVALACEVEISKIKGLYNIKIEQTNKEDIPLFSDDDLDKEEDNN